MKKNNFHTHTYRCGHAVGNEEEMVEAAIKNGLVELGFSCHVPLPHYRRHIVKGIFDIKTKESVRSFLGNFIHNGPNMRMPYPQKEIHTNNVKKLKEQYKNQITIYQGFEAEYFNDYLDYYRDLLQNSVDYLILGHHFNKIAIHANYFGSDTMPDEKLLAYKDQVIQALDTNLFSYIAHPDLFMIGRRRWDELCQSVTTEICLKAKEKNVPLEINSGGIRRGLRKVDDELVYQYPNTHFWDVVSSVGNDVVLGLDAHSPKDFNDENYAKMIQFAMEHKLNIVDHFEFKKG